MTLNSPQPLFRSYRLLFSILAFAFLIPSIRVCGQNCTVTEAQLVQAPDVNDPTFGGNYGWATAMSGSVAVIGAIHADNLNGKIYVYRFDGASWIIEAELNTPNPGMGGQFGASVGVSGNTIVVGEPFITFGGEAGAAHVFYFDAVVMGWVNGPLLLPGGLLPGDEYGHSVSISGDVIAVGAHLKNTSDAGAAYIFRRNDNGTPGNPLDDIWLQESIVFTSGSPQAGDQFGESVSVSGNTLLVGAPLHNAGGVSNAGQVYVFTYDGVQWMEDQQLTAVDAAGLPNLTVQDEFGFSISFDGSAAIIGSPNDDNAQGTNAGAAYVFRDDGMGSFVYEDKIIASGSAQSHLMGMAVSIEGGTAVMGSEFATARGSAYVFAFDSGTTTWNERFKLKPANDAAPSVSFGHAVAVVDEQVLVGASTYPVSQQGGGFFYDSFIDCDLNGVDDRCEPDLPDCNGNGIKDGCDIALGTSEDCNFNGIPDECDTRGPVFLSSHNADGPDQCPTGSLCGGLWPDLLDYAILNSRSPGNGILAIGLNGGAAEEAIVNWMNGMSVLGVTLTKIEDLPDTTISNVAFENYAVLYIPTFEDLLPQPPFGSGGGITDAQLTELKSRKTDIEIFVNDLGGGLIALAEVGAIDQWQWLPSVFETVGFNQGTLGTYGCPTPALLNIASETNCDNLTYNLPDPPRDLLGYSEAFTGPPGLFGYTPLIEKNETEPGESPPVFIGWIPTGVDCNGDGVIDFCGGGDPEPDCNMNGILDVCEADCNGNGIPDDCDIASEYSVDCNLNGIPDECESRGPVFLSGHDDDDVGHCDQGGSCGGLWPTLLKYVVDNSMISGPKDILAIGVQQGQQAEIALTAWNDPGNGGPGVPVTYITSTSTPSIADVDFSNYSMIYIPSSDNHTAGGINSSDLAALALRKADIALYVTNLGGGLIALTEGFAFNGYDWLPFAIETQSVGHSAVCPTTDLQSLVPGITCAHLTSPPAGPYHSIFTGSLSTAGFTVFSAWDDESGSPDLNNPVLIGWLSSGDLDCNNNGTLDECEIASDPDCNENGIPDECDPDCNNNGFPDGCDIANGFALDCNFNGIPDRCEVKACRADISPPCTVQPATPDVNIDDLVAVLNAFGPCLGCPEDFMPKDDLPVGDGVVDIDELVDVLNNFGPCAPGGSGATAITLVQMDFSSGYVLADGSVDVASATLVSAAWINTSANWDVYRLFAQVSGPSAILSYCGGSTTGGPGGTPEPLVLNPGKGGQFYIPLAGSYAPPNLAMLAIDGGTGFELQQAAFGSYIAMGEAFGAGPSKMGDTAALDNILTSFVNDPNTGWGVYGAVAGQGVVPDGNGGWRVLIGQFTVPKGKTFTAAVRLAGDGIDVYATVNSGVTTLP